MTYIPSVSIKETRENLSHLVDQVAIANKKFLITKFNKPKAMIVPISAKTKTRKSLSGLDATFGMWKDRKNMKNSAKWVANQRKQWSSRYK